jgi:cytochrome c-type biogenesis protein CcmH
MVPADAAEDLGWSGVICRAATGRLVAILLILTTLGVATMPTVSAAAQVRERATVQGMYNDLMCVLCHESLAVAQSPESYQERSLVRGFVAQGLTVKQIENRMVAQYGPAVLAQPPKHGFSLLIYIIPPVVVLMGILLLFYTVPRWRRKSAAARAAPGDDGGPPISEQESQRLDQELAERF